MKVPTLGFSAIRRTRSKDQTGVVATARLDQRTKNLIKRLKPGDIAIIDHIDLDRVAADALVRSQVKAVINVAPSISGRYPNQGPQVLIDAGIPLVDDVGPDVFDLVKEGQQIRLDGETVYLADAVVAKGTWQTAESVASDMATAKDGLAEQLRAFVTNTFEYINRDSELLAEGIRMPDLKTKLAGRHALVVARGYRYHEDLKALRSYIREFKPVIIAVDGGANALIEAGYWPHMIVGDMDSVSDRALKSGAEVVVVAYMNGHAPGLPRVQDLGIDSVICPSPGTSEDVAVLLADEGGASLIVTVGMRYGLVEFLDKGRSGMASAVLTRIRVGDKIVDAKGVSRLYQSRISGKSLGFLAIAALAPIIALAWTPVGKLYLGYLGLALSQLWYWLTGLL
jgi:uncharacterized membrane-anchored protein